MERNRRRKPIIAFMWRNTSEAEATERRHEIVKKLLEKLPESERTVVTLYYLGEMTMKEISKFLGVSVKDDK